MSQGRHAVLLQELTQLTTRAIEPLGLELVELSLRGPSRRRVLRLDIDRAGPEGVRLEDCQLASGEVGDALDQVEILEDQYVLEISSPGIDRPIETDDDIRRNTGRKVAVDWIDADESQRQITGLLVGGGTDWLEVRIDDGPEDEAIVRIARDQIRLVRQDVSF